MNNTNFKKMHPQNIHISLMKRKYNQIGYVDAAFGVEIKMCKFKFAFFFLHRNF